MSSSQISPRAATEQSSEQVPVRLPELLAPAGDWECARAAVENGADAIYFGLEKFNARMRAQNFTEADLPELMEFLHRRGVKGYVTFNILVFENELEEAQQYARTIIAAGVDAAIVQDVGICRMLRELSPDFPIHVSTQMTITSAAGVEFARELECNLVVLARECSLKEIEKITALESTLPLEVFIHGALCVAYSGQCLTSEALGGRSANRGECAQACRMPYELLADGKLVPLGDRKYLLSPQDLAGVELLPELVRLGVASLKIEGRLKTPEYVANITRIYRKALDHLSECGVRSAECGVPESPKSESLEARRQKADGRKEPIPHSAIRNPHLGAPHYEMEMAFSRGLYTGWFRGTNNQALVHGRFGKKRGVYLGQVIEVRGQSMVVELEGPLKRGDGVVFDAGRPEEKEEGGRVYEIRPSGARVLLGFGRGDIDFSRIRAGDKVWKTSDPELERKLRKSFEGDTPKFQRPLSFEVHGRPGTPLTVIARDELGHIVRLHSQMPLAKAETQPLTTERLRGQLGRLGGTPFKLGALKNALEGGVVLPLSELNRLRRELVAELKLLRAQPPRWGIPKSETPKADPSSVAASLSRLEEGLLNPLPAEGRARAELRRVERRPKAEIRTERPGSDIPHSALLGASKPGEDGRTARSEFLHSSFGLLPSLIVLARNLEQLGAALESEAETVYCEFEDPKKYREAVRIVREARGTAPAGSHPLEIFVAPPRIFKMGEEWTLKQVRSSEADGYLIRNYDHLKFFANDRRIGDYSLNIANHLSAEYFKEKFGLERVTASYDLNFTQLESLLKAAPPDWFEITIHQHMPMFHMEHCVFCAFLSSGTDYTNCGRPCDTHDLKLRDRVGAQHPVKADAGCRNTVFNALAQTGAEYVLRMLELGVRHFRLEFLTETPQQVALTIGKYRQLLRGEINGAQLWRELKLLNQLGVTRGQMGNHE